MSGALRSARTWHPGAGRDRERHELGAQRYWFRHAGSRWWFMLAAMIVLYVVATMLGGSTAVRPASPALPVAEPAMLLAGAALCVMLGLWRNTVLGRRRLQIFEHGFALVEGRRVVRCRWDQIAAVHSGVAAVRGYDVLRLAPPSLLVERQDGTTIELGRYGDAGGRLLELLEVELERSARA